LWYLDDGDLLPCVPTAADAKYKDFITRLNRIKEKKDVEIYGRIQLDICNVGRNMISGVQLQIKCTKAGASFYLMNKDAESKTYFKFIDAYLLVNRVKPNTRFVSAHNETLVKGVLEKYNLTRVELKTSTFSS